MDYLKMLCGQTLCDVGEGRLFEWCLGQQTQLNALFVHEANWQWEQGSRGALRTLVGAREMTLPEFVGYYINYKWTEFAKKN